MAVGMTVPMAAWMLNRGMGQRNTLEMSAAMILPALPFLCLVWLDLTGSALCGPYCLLTVAAMLLLMSHRRSEHSQGDVGSLRDYSAGSLDSATW